jgi:mucin-19
VNRPLGSWLRAWRYGRHVPIAGLLLCAGPALANPLNGQVVGGQATIATTAPNTLTIDQTTPRAAIDWQSFNIAPNETTQFVQPSASSVALNRVQAGDPSVIAGRLTANGQLVLVNPSGVVFTRGSQVNVNSLVATTTGISTENFMAGKMVFDQPSSDPGARVINNGSITVAQAGLAALVAPGVANNGVIAAKLGQVILGGAQTYTLDFYGDGLIQFAVGAPVTTVPVGRNGQQLASLVSNTGQINAPVGTVLLTANAVSGILDHVIDSPGTINAPTSGQIPGSVTLAAGAGNAAQLSGNINVSGLSSGQTGGTAVLTGGSVDLTSTAGIDARGTSGGGTVRVIASSAGYSGQPVSGLVSNSAGVTIGAGAVIDASATQSGNGGAVSVLSDTTTTFAGTILANGGPLGGNGGTIETSGGQVVLGLAATVSAAAPLGKAGLWLLDPTDLTIDAPAATTISNTLNGHTDVTEETTANGTSGFGPTATGNGDIDVTGAISWGTANTLTLSAYNNIIVSAPITVSGAGTLVLTYNNGIGGTNTADALSFVMGSGSAQFTPQTAGQALYINNGTPGSGNGTLYTLIYDTGVSATGIKSLNGSSGNYALATPLDATSLGTLGNALILSFGGNFNGLGNTIANLKISGNSNCSIDGGLTCSGLFGQLNSSGSISNFGVVGGSVTDTASSGYDGDLVGITAGRIVNSYATGTITGGNGGAAGGLVGLNLPSGTITGSYATGAVTVSGSAGTIGGLAGQSDGTIANSYATGAVTGTNNSAVGGLVGEGNPGFKITDAFATGNVTGGGGLISNGGGTITGGYYDATTTGQPHGTQSNGSIGLTTGELSAALPTGFSSSIWGNANNQTTPYLLSNPGPVILGTEESEKPTFYNPILNYYALQAIGNNSATLSQNYVLAQDIDATGYSGFTPIGESTAFSGILNGLGNVVANLTINSNATNAGLFGQSSGTIENVGLIGGSVTDTAAGAFVGGLVGYASGGTISNVYTTGTVTDGGSGSWAGGLVGENRATIENSYTTGTVTGTRFTGGLVGENEGTVQYAYSTATVSGTSEAVGGLIGADGGTTQDVYAAGPVSGSGALVGGLIGIDPASVTNGYWDSDRSSAISGGATNAVGGGSSVGIGTLTGADAFTLSNYTAFTASTTPGATGNAWVIVDIDSSLNNTGGVAGGTLPMLASEAQSTIQNAHQLQLMAMNLGVAASYTLGRNIDATATGSSTGFTSGTDVWGATGFVPVGNSPLLGPSTTNFNGVFNGLGNTITNLTITSSEFYVGLFGQSFGTIENVGLAGGAVTSTNSICCAAGIGDLAGANGNIIADVFATGAVSVSGANTSSSIGGLVGVNFGTINDAYATGAVTGGANSCCQAGGLIGLNNGGIFDAYATGAVSGQNYTTGGLVGSNGLGIIDGYYDAGTTGQPLGTQGDNSVGLTTAQLQSFEFNDNADFGHNTLWGIVSGKSYPYLCFQFGNCTQTP